MLEENGRYESVKGKKIHLSEAIHHNQMVRYYGMEIFKILKIETPEWDKWEEILKDEKIIVGLTDDLNMPRGYRHHRSGKCLGGNTPMSAHSEKYEPYLTQFDIKTE